MTRLTRSLLVVAVAIALTGAAVALPVLTLPIFVEIDGITADGEDVEVVSFSYGVERELAVSDCAAAGDAQLNDLLVVVALDRSSPKLLEAIAKGEKFAEVGVEIREGSDRYALNYVNVEVAEVEGDRETLRAHLAATPLYMHAGRRRTRLTRAGATRSAGASPPRTAPHPGNRRRGTGDGLQGRG